MHLRGDGDDGGLAQFQYAAECSPAPHIDVVRHMFRTLVFRSWEILYDVCTYSPMCVTVVKCSGLKPGVTVITIKAEIGLCHHHARFLHSSIDLFDTSVLLFLSKSSTS
jgi:hypothetical protein